MLRIRNWLAVLASWLVILANVQGGSAEVELPTSYRKVQADANEDRTFGLVLELNATPLTTDSRIEESSSVLPKNIREDGSSTDNPQLGDEAKSLITTDPEIRRCEETVESDQSDSSDSKESCKNEIDVLKWASTRAKSPSFTDDPTTESVKHQAKEWSRLTSFKTLRKKSAREELSDFRRPSIKIPEFMYSQDAGNPIGHSAAQETRLLNPSSTLPSKSADRNVNFTLKKEQLQAILEDQTSGDDLKSDEEISQNIPQYTGKKSINEQAELDRENRFFDKRDSRPTGTSKVTRQSSTIVAGVRKTFMNKKSDTRNLSGQRADSYRASSQRPLRTYSWKDNGETTNQPLLTETRRVSDIPIHSNMNKLPNPETTATPSISFSSNTEYTLRKVSFSVNRGGETETSTTVGYEDKSLHDTIKKEHRAFEKFTIPVSKEATTFSLRSQSNEEGNTAEAPRDATVAIEFQTNTSPPVRFNTAANVLVKQRRTTVREKTVVAHETKEESRLLPRESVKAKFRVSKRQGVSKDLGEKSNDILYSTEREAFSGEATTSPDIHWNVEQTDVTIGRPVIIEKVFASGSDSTTSGYHDLPVKRRKHRNQLLDILGRNIAFSGSSTQEPLETNSRSDRASNILQEVVASPAEKEKLSVVRENVPKVGTGAIASKEDRVVIKAPEKEEADRNENAVTAKPAAFQSKRTSGELDYTRSKSEVVDSFETGLSSKYKAIPSDKHRKATFEASYERHSMPDQAGKQSRNPIMRERYASDARREMTGQLTEAKAAPNMEREDRPSIAARNVEVPYTNSATGHPGDPRDQWIARNPKIERLAILNLTGTVDTHQELTTEQQTNENPPLHLSSICQDQKDKKECVNEDDRQDLYDSSTERQMVATKDSMEESQLVWNTPGENKSSKLDKSMGNEATEKYIELVRTTEKGSNETMKNGSYTETDERVNDIQAKETSTKGETTLDPNGQDGIPSVTDALRERHSRAGRFWHVRRNQSLAYIGNSSSSTLPQETNTERQPLDRVSDDLAVGEEYDPLGTAAMPTKIDLPPQSFSASTDGIPSSSDRAIDLEMGKPVTHGVEMETLDVASTNWSESYTDDGSSTETTTLRETVSMNDESLMEKKHSQRSDNVLEMSTEHWLNIEKEPIKFENSSIEVKASDQWPVKHSAVVEGDLVLGGLMMVHEREDNITCGPVMPQGGVQALEAMLYTLDNVNQLNIVPDVKIGAHILDDCDKDTYGLEMAVDFIKGSISNIDGAEYHCNKTAVRKVISGVVGAASSVTSIQVANLLRLFRIPQVSFFSTSPELSNKQRFEYFTRTIPSDHYQVKAMVDIIRTIGWSYVSIIYEESNYGIKAFEELEELLGKYNICIAIKEKLVKDSGVAEETAYDNIVLKLLTKPRAKGCIIFGSDQEVAGVMRAVRRCNATGAFSWIGSDGWSARDLVSNGNEPEVEGTLSVQPQANPVRGFEEYFLNLTVENNRRNPWFVEFWEDHFQCRYPNSSLTPYNEKYTKICTTKERLTKQDTAFEDQLQFVSDAVMAFAYAFRDMHNKMCHGKAGLCDAMKPTEGTELLKYLRKVDFEGLSGDRFKFDKNGDGPARYNIIHFKQTNDGKYKWIRVGKYLEGELRLNMSEIQFKRGHHEPPESVCSLPCEVGQAKKYVEGERCCWHCFNCTQYQIRHPKDETQCIPCRQGTVPDETHSSCRDIPEEFLRPESGWAIGAMSFSATGMLITFFVCGVFLRYNDTPVVRASGRELSYVLLSGILLCYLVTFALILRPTDIVCGIQRFAAGFCFTVVYAALLTKTNRISRIFNASKHSAKRPSFISPRSQLIICAGLVFVQILINGVWMVIDPARAMHHYPTREDNLLVCNSYIDASYMIAFAYPIMLIVVCTVYAVLTRKIPEAFNESKHIGFTMYTTCVIWLAFVPLYFGTGNNVALRITSMSITISLSASVTIVCLFSPKLYIILIRPERNVRQSMMPFRCGTTKSSAGTTNASSMIAPVTLTAATCDQNKAVKKHIATTIDCSTQSEYYELEVKDQKNGKPPPAVMSRSTQTSASDKDTSASATTNKEMKETMTTSKKVNNNNARIGNGPVAQSDVSL